jgi:probable Rubsico expression protein CbbX
VSPPTNNGFNIRRPGEDLLGQSLGAHAARLAETLHSAEIIDLVAERTGLDIDPVLDCLDRELAGLSAVKTRVHQIAALLEVDRLRSRYGLTSSRPTLHLCFTGGPGTGKTTVALRVAEILKGLGYLDRGQLVTVTADELIGQYIGHTAPRTNEVLKRALGGVLFIDEAYDLDRADKVPDDGAESIEILLQAMESQREQLVVVLAGCQDRMDSFLQSNPDMSSRIAYHIDFPDYTLDELCAIAELMLAEQRYEFSPEAREAFRHYLQRRMDQPRFANARSVRDVLEGIRLRHAHRITSSGRLRCSRRDLMRIEPDDILAGLVMAGERL